SILAIPLFILMGELLSRFGFADDLIAITRRMYRSRVGYSLKLNVILSLLLSCMSGSALADIGATGRMQIAASVTEGVPASVAAGLTMASAAIGPIFPPSIPLLVFAIAANTSSVRMLIAGIGPALLIAAILYVTVLIYLRVRGRQLAAARLEPDGGQESSQ